MKCFGIDVVQVDLDSLRSIHAITAFGKPLALRSTIKHALKEGAPLTQQLAMSHDVLSIKLDNDIAIVKERRIGNCLFEVTMK